MAAELVTHSQCDPDHLRLVDFSSERCSDIAHIARQAWPSRDPIAGLLRPGRGGPNSIMRQALNAVSSRRRELRVQPVDAQHDIGEEVDSPRRRRD